MSTNKDEEILLPVPIELDDDLQEVVLDSEEQDKKAKIREDNLAKLQAEMAKDQYTLERRTRFYEIYKKHGDYLFKLLSYPDAIYYYSLAISCRGNEAIVYANRSLAHFKLESYNNALEDGARSIEIDPNYIKGHYRVGVCYMALARWQSAVDAFTHILDIRPNEPGVRQQLILARKLLREQQFSRAISGLSGNEDDENGTGKKRDVNDDSHLPLTRVIQSPRVLLKRDPTKMPKHPYGRPVPINEKTVAASKNLILPLQFAHENPVLFFARYSLLDDIDYDVGDKSDRPPPAKSSMPALSYENNKPWAGPPIDLKIDYLAENIYHDTKNPIYCPDTANGKKPYSKKYTQELIDYIIKYYFIPQKSHLLPKILVHHILRDFAMLNTLLPTVVDYNICPKQEVEIWDEVEYDDELIEEFVVPNTDEPIPLPPKKQKRTRVKKVKTEEVKTTTEDNKNNNDDNKQTEEKDTDKKTTEEQQDKKMDDNKNDDDNAAKKVDDNNNNTNTDAIVAKEAPNTSSEDNNNITSTTTDPSPADGNGEATPPIPGTSSSQDDTMADSTTTTTTATEAEATTTADESNKDKKDDETTDTTKDDNNNTTEESKEKTDSTNTDNNTTTTTTDTANNTTTDMTNEDDDDEYEWILEDEDDDGPPPVQQYIKGPRITIQRKTRIKRWKKVNIRKISPKLNICGDTHGQFYDVLNIFKLYGKPSLQNPYLFNGDFVDRGSFGYELVLTLMLYKLHCPLSIHLTRGNHETVQMNRSFGFQGEVLHKTFNDQLIFDLFTLTFNTLPLAYVLNTKVLILHGGLPTDDRATLAELRKLVRFCQPDSSLGGSSLQQQQHSLMIDTLWSDPSVMHYIRGRRPSPRGAGCLFGADVTERFCRENRLDLVIRSHEMKYPGFEVVHNNRLITVFSAPNYIDQMNNKGAVIIMDHALRYEIKQFVAVPHPDVRAMIYADPYLRT